MSVIYTCIAYKTTPLVQRGKTDKAEKQIGQDIENILQNFVGKDNMRSSSEQNNMNLYVLILNQVTYLCYCDSGVSKVSAFALLSDLAESFIQRYNLSVIKQAVKLQMDREFGAILGQKVNNIKLYQSKTSEIQKDLEDAKGLVMDNVDRVMKRANDLDNIKDEAEELKNNAYDFMDNSAKLKKQMLCKKYSIIGGVTFAIVAVIIIIVVPMVV